MVFVKLSQLVAQPCFKTLIGIALARSEQKTFRVFVALSANIFGDRLSWENIKLAGVHPWARYLRFDRNKILSRNAGHPRNDDLKHATDLPRLRGLSLFNFE